MPIMQSSSLVRASSTRNICIFCAIRGCSDGIFPSIRRSTVAKQRNLHYSRNSPQSASATQVREDDNRPSPSSSSGGWGQPFGAPALASTFSIGLTPEEQRFKDNLQRQREQKLSTARNTPRSQRQDKGSFGFNNSSNRDPSSSSSRAPEGRYVVRRVNMNTAGPIPSNLPTINPEGTSTWTHLRRKGEVRQPSDVRDQLQPRSSARSAPAPSGELGDFLKSLEKNPTPSKPRRQQVDDGELQRLLRGVSNHDNAQQDRKESRRYVPLARESIGGMRCFRCGQQGHRGSDCPNISRFIPTSQLAQVQQRFNANAHLQERRNEDSTGTEDKAPKPSTEASSIVSATDRYDEEKRVAAEAWQRRAARFSQDDDAVRSNDRRKTGRGRIMRSRNDDEEDEGLHKADRKRQRKAERRRAQASKTEPTPINIPEYISVTNLASALKVRVEDFVRKLEELGFEEIQNDHILNAENSALVAMEYNFEPIIQKAEEDDDLYAATLPEDISALPARPPVVTIMGHVDHGKTTILDFLRNSSVAASEFGGITQHIGAFSVPLASGKTITFLDTPGHAAFLSMRQRGANVTDIVILVVAADDSVKPQTIEAIKHAQSANVPIIVAINKIDKEEANPDRVKQDLARHGVDVEDYGGDTQVVCVSGKTGTGMSELEEAVVTLSEILDHRADPEGPVEGWVLEGTTRKSGRVATLLIRRGTLRVGDVLVAGTTWARVRTLKNEAGAAIDEVGPGMPVEVDGWREQPLAGDEVLEAPDEQKASAVSEYRADIQERIRLAKDMEAINETRRRETEKLEKEKAATAAEAAGEDEAVIEAGAKTSGPELIPFIVKADVSGSVEAVTDSIVPLGNAEVGCTILRSGVGPPSEFDVEHAAAAKGHIINFNTSVPPQIAALAEDKGVRVLDSNIIYRLSEDVKALLSEKLAPTVVKRVTGEAEIAQAFSITIGGRKKMQIAGSKVRNGTIKRGSLVRVVRGDKTVYEGTLSSLKNVKKDVLEMPKNSECGIGFDDWESFEVGDKVQCYEETSEKRYL